MNYRGELSIALGIIGYLAGGAMLVYASPVKAWMAGILLTVAGMTGVIAGAIMRGRA